MVSCMQHWIGTTVVLKIRRMSACIMSALPALQLPVGVCMEVDVYASKFQPCLDEVVACIARLARSYQHFPSSFPFSFCHAALPDVHYVYHDVQVATDY